MRAGGILLDKGHASLALTEARRAFQEAGDEGSGLDGLALTAVVHARLGHDVEAQQALEDLTRMANAVPSERDKRRVHHVAGRLALDRRT